MFMADFFPFYIMGGLTSHTADTWASSSSMKKKIFLFFKLSYNQVKFVLKSTNVYHRHRHHRLACNMST